MTPFKYAPSCYDEKFHLRVSPLLWLVILWSTHHVLALGVAAMANSGEIFSAAMKYAYNLPSLLSDIPGVLVLFARMNRSPVAGDRIRWVWRNGRALLALGLCMQLGAVVMLRWKAIAELDETTLATLCVTAVLLAALLASRYIKDVFADFPLPETAGKE
jgi:hypothetical protein